MKLDRLLGAMVVLAAFVLGLSAAMPSTISAQNPEQALTAITSPADGTQLFGPVNIRGSAAHPTAFSRYELEYDDLSDPNVLWLPVQSPVQQQVRDGVLGTWNTQLVPDGFYRLRLRVFLIDGQVGEAVISTLRVMNSMPTPIPTFPAANPAPGAMTPSPGPSPTSLVVQPPANVAAPTALPGLAPPPASDQFGDASSVGARLPTTRVNTGRLGDAFCAGFYLAFAGFAIMLGYVLLRRRPRPFTAREVWQPPDGWRDER